MADKLNGILISEILADNASGHAVDTDGDGTANKTDEFIELQNATAKAISLDGYALWSDKGGLLYTFQAGDQIAAGETATVVGNYSGSTIPDGYYDAGVAEGTNWLPDGEGQKFETIYLVDTSTGDYILLSYGNPPRPPDPPPDFPGTTLIGGGESIDSNAPNARSILRDANGDLVEGMPTPGTPGVPCFTQGTLIETAQGHVPVECILPGTRLRTRDAGLVTVRAVRQVRISPLAQRRWPEICPITVPAGAFGDHNRLTLSPAHRILHDGGALELITGHAEALVSAAQSVGYAGVWQHEPGSAVVYVHLLLDSHQIIRANGLWTESLFLGDVAHRALQASAGWQVERGVALASLRHPAPVRPILTGYEAAVYLGHRFGRGLAKAPQAA